MASNTPSESAPECIECGEREIRRRAAARIANRLGHALCACQRCIDCCEFCDDDDDQGEFDSEGE